MIRLVSSSVFSFPKEHGRDNEDSVLPLRRVGDGFVTAVADGVGSYAGARSASEAAIDYLANIETEELNSPDSVGTILNRIKDRVARLALEEPEYSSAATTLTYCHAGAKGLTIGHIGDCRFYLKSGDKLLQITKDHTQHQILIDEGLYKPSELKEVGGKNTLFSAISKKIPLKFQEIYLPYETICGAQGEVVFYMMSDGAYRAWESRPRFLESTLADPSRFAANLQRRIIRLEPSDDISLVGARLLTKPQLELFD